MKIKVLITGGTIDKAYKELTGELSFTETHMVDMFNRGRCMADTLSEVLFLKDSLEILLQLLGKILVLLNFGYLITLDQ